MKLVLAIVQDDDAIDLIEELTDKDYRWVFKIRKYYINDWCWRKGS